MKSASEWESEILRLKTGNVAKVILAIQSDARESALREAADAVRELKAGSATDMVAETFAVHILSLLPEASK